MKINELKQYKALDITQLSGSPWNTAEKVLGLDENDKVVMAEPEEAVTPEYVENAIDQAMEAETARTESTYLKEHQSLEDYATKDYVDQAIADVDVSDQLVNYALKTGVTQDIASATAYTMDQVEAKGYVTDQELGDYAKTTAVTQDIQTAIAAETARTEDAYMKIGDVPSLDGYWTSAQTESAITQSIAAETARTENTYAKPGDIPSLDGYWTSAQTNNAITAATENLASKDDIPTAQDGSDVKQYVYCATGTTSDDKNKYLVTDISLLNNVVSNSKTPRLSIISKYWGGIKGNSTSYIYERTGDITRPGLKTLRDSAIINSAEEALAGFDEEITLTLGDVSEVDYVAGKLNEQSNQTAYLYETDDERYEVLPLSGFTTSDYIDSFVIDNTTLYPYNFFDLPMGGEKLQLETYTGNFKRLSFTYIAGQDYYLIIDKELLTLEVASGLTFTRTKSIQGALDNLDLTDYAKTTAVTADIASAIATETARTENTYAKPGDIPSLDGYATEAYVTAATQDMATKTWVGQQGYAVSSAVTEDINTAIANETARTENTYAKPGDIPSLDGYWTSAQTENAITAATDDMATKTWVGEQGFLTEHQDISGKLDVSVFTGYTGTTETAINGKVGLDVYSAYTGSTATAIAGKVDNTTFTGYTGDTQTALNGKVGLDVYSAYTGSTATAIAAKQDTLVSGTNIKTINNQSLLGSGNIDIQGGGGGGSVVELTQAQYDALDPPAQDTTYIITDAETVDLNDYAMASGLTELSGTVETINSNYATKANTTARSAPYLPSWNAQGIITGSSTFYQGAFNMNGTALGNVIKSSNSVGATWFAPTSKGTAGQVLQSPSSGNEPTWSTYKFAFITQTQYDALSTKDATTIYFITGE